MPLTCSVICCAYLASITVASLMHRKMPSMYHLVAALSGCVVLGLEQGLGCALVSATVAIVVLLMLAVLAKGHVSGVGVMTIAVSVAASPARAWWALPIGFALAAVAAAVQMYRRGGSSQLAILLTQTMAAAGVRPSGGLSRPDPTGLPTRADHATKARLYLAPFLLAGYVVVTVLARI